MCVRCNINNPVKKETNLICVYKSIYQSDTGAECCQLLFFSSVMADIHSFYSTLAEALSNPRLLESTRRAAVAIVLRDEPGVLPTTKQRRFPQVLLIQRAPNPGDPWSAHLAFPGGRRDERDKSDLDCAIREAREETGLDLDNVAVYQLLGRLDDRPINRNQRHDRSVLSAFVFRQLCGAFPKPLRLQAEEVASAFWVSLDYVHHASPTVCYHIVHRTRHVDAKLYERMVFLLMDLFGFTSLRMPAVDVLPFALNRMYAGSKSAPHMFLWGLTLGCLGDIVTALGLYRVDWFLALPRGRMLGGVVWTLAAVYVVLVGFIKWISRGW